ncbi:MAG: HAD family hydrolase, partial [Candidatus Korobacteraceae bacterium]
VQMCAEVVRNAADLRAIPCASAQQVLEWLQVSGKLLWIITGNLEPIGWAKLEAAGLRDYFEFGGFSCHLDLNGKRLDRAVLRFERRAEILAHAVAQVRDRLGSSASICVVGDTPNDIHAARELGLPIIAVATGTFPRGQLEPLSPDLCLDCLDELLTD